MNINELLKLECVKFDESLVGISVSNFDIEDIRQNNIVNSNLSIPILDEFSKVKYTIQDFVKKNNLICFTANQVGYGFNYAFVDNEHFVNIKITALSSEFHMENLPLPKKNGATISTPVYDKVSVTAYLVGDDLYPIQFSPANEKENIMWQFVGYMLGGLNENDIVYSKTIVSNNKQKPNDMCSCGSGKKYKKCCMRK